MLEDSFIISVLSATSLAKMGFVERKVLQMASPETYSISNSVTMHVISLHFIYTWKMRVIYSTRWEMRERERKRTSQFALCAFWFECISNELSCVYAFDKQNFVLLDAFTPSQRLIWFHLRFLFSSFPFYLSFSLFLYLVRFNFNSVSFISTTTVDTPCRWRETFLPSKLIFHINLNLSDEESHKHMHTHMHARTYQPNGTDVKIRLFKPIGK